MGKDKLDEALEGTPSPVGDNSTHSTKRSASRDYIESYYSSPELISRLERLQEEWGVNKSELTRWLLEKALELVDKGRLRPTKERKTTFRLD